jgi:hypothetical protein
MTTIIILIVLSIVLFFTRKIWSNFLVSFFAKRKTLATSIKQDGSVFSPRGTIRTFVVAIDIEELGDGTAKISLAKLKEKEV